MRRVLVLGGALAAAGLGALALAGGPTPPVLRPEPEVRVVHVNAPTMAISTIDLHNDSGATITVASLTRDPSCDPQVTTTLTTPAIIMSGNSAPVAIGCSGTITAGMKRCLVRAKNAAGELLADLEAVCEGGTATTLAVSPAAIDFGDVPIGGTAAMPVALTSSGGPTVAKVFLQTTSLDNTFVLAAPCNPDARECDAAIVGLMTGGTTEIGVTCRPTSPGVHTAELRIASDTNAYLGTPLMLTCNATAAAGPVLAVTGDPVNAGEVEVSDDLGVDPRPLRLRNAGTGNVIISGVQISDDDGSASDWDFTVSGACTGTATACSLGQDDLAEIALHFNPSQIGPRPAVLVIGYTEAGTARSLAIPLAGVGLGATITRLGTGNLNFGSVPLNTTSRLQVTLVNGGNRDATVMITPTPAGAPFVPAPPASVVVKPGEPEVIDVDCLPTSVGSATTVLRVMATEATGTPIDINALCTGVTGPLFANPTTIALGEVRTGPQTTMVTVQASTTGPALTIASAVLAAASDTITIVASLPSAAPTAITLTIAPESDGVIDNELVITATNGAVVRVPITGTIVTAAFSVRPLLALGTFCIDRPTTPDVVELRSTGTATIGLTSPTMALGTQSPFNLAPETPTTYPALLAPGTSAAVSITPKRSLDAGVQIDDIVWTTDVVGMTTERTTVSAAFVDDGGAIAPSALSFGPSVIHLDSVNAQRVTLQNCDTQPIVFDSVDLPSPFRIDVGRIPPLLEPNETATFSIGFHPTRTGVVSTQMEITAPQLSEPLVIRLDGEGIVTTPPPDAAVPATGGDEESFYGCAGCASGPSGSGLFPLGALAFSLWRRRRGSSSAR